MRPRPLQASTFFAILLTATLSAHAADPKPAPKGKGPLLTRAELRECMAQPPRLKVEADEIAKQLAARDADKADIEREGEALKQELATVDRTSAEAVAAYNAKAQARDARVDAYNAGNAAHNSRVEALQAKRAAYATACENRRFDEKDEIAIKAGK